jgi:hypothetical protein
MRFLEATGKDVVHVVEEAPKIVASIGKLLADGVSLAPEVKSAIQNIMQAGEAVVLAGWRARRIRGRKHSTGPLDRGSSAEFHQSLSD